MARYGVIDLGSNSVRLVIYEVTKAARDAVKSGKVALHNRQRIFKTVLDEKKIVGLSAYVQDGELSAKGIKAAVDAVNSHLKRTRDLGCKNVEVFATAFLRNCRNSTKAKNKIEDACSINVKILSAAQEAHLGFVGASCNGPLSDGTLIDIGGGSTELTRVSNDVDSLNISIPLGSVSSYASHVSVIIPSRAEVDAISRDYASRFADKKDAEGGGIGNSTSLIKPKDYECARMYGIGGGSRASYKLALELFGESIVGTDGTKATRPVIGIDSIASVLRCAIDNPSQFAHAAVRAVPARLHTCIPGVAIMYASMQMFGAKELVICKYGLREGYLLEHML